MSNQLLHRKKRGSFGHTLREACKRQEQEEQLVGHRRHSSTPEDAGPGAGLIDEGAKGADVQCKIHACMEGKEEDVLTELMDGLCKFFARTGEHRPPVMGSSSCETPRKIKEPSPTLC